MAGTQQMENPETTFALLSDPSTAHLRYAGAPGQAFDVAAAAVAASMAISMRRLGGVDAGSSLEEPLHSTDYLLLF